MITIHVRLLGMLRDKLPREAKGRASLELPDGATVADLLAQLELRGHLQVAINDTIVENEDTPLRSGDQVEIFRPAAGGAGAP